jgi:hypothetical protein
MRAVATLDVPCETCNRVPTRTTRRTRLCIPCGLPVCVTCASLWDSSRIGKGNHQRLATETYLAGTLCETCFVSIRVQMGNLGMGPLGTLIAHIVANPGLDGGKVKFV